MIEVNETFFTIALIFAALGFVLIVFLAMYLVARWSRERDSGGLKDGDLMTRGGKIYRYSSALGWMELSRAQIAEIPEEERTRLALAYYKEMERNWWDETRDTAKKS